MKRQCFRVCIILLCLFMVACEQVHQPRFARCEIYDKKREVYVIEDEKAIQKIFHKLNQCLDDNQRVTKSNFIHTPAYKIEFEGIEQAFFIYQGHLYHDNKVYFIQNPQLLLSDIQKIFQIKKQKLICF